MNDAQTISAHNDEIDLYELWSTLIKHKVLIVFITILSTCFAGVFAWNTTPIYTGNALIEVGEIVNQTDNNQTATTVLKLDANLGDLKEVTSKMMNVAVSIPNGSSNVIQLSVDDSSPSEIKSILQKSVDFIIARHQEKAKFYSNENSKIRMTQLIGDIYVSHEPIKPNKKIIIVTGFISGLILSIFLAFALEFFQRNRKPRN